MALSVSNFTQDLYATLRESRATLDAVIEEEMLAAREATAKANALITEQQQAIDAASAELVQLEMHGLSVDDNKDGKSDENGACAADKQELEEKLQKQHAENEQLEASLQAEKKQMEDLIQEHKQQKEQFQLSQQKWNATKAAKQTTVDDLTRGIINYKYLGLDFVKADQGRLRFSFTQLDPNNPEQQFSFELETLVDEDRWTVVEMNPPGVISPDRLDELLAPLNDSDDMNPFIRGMRQAFLESIY